MEPNMATEEQSALAEQEHNIDEAESKVEEVHQEDKLPTENEANEGVQQADIVPEAEPKVEVIQPEDKITVDGGAEPEEIKSEVPAEQIQQEDKAEEIQQEDKAEAEVSVKEIPQGDGDGETEVTGKEVHEERKINESEEKAKRMQQENEITYADEKIQAVVDLDQVWDSGMADQHHITLLDEEAAPGTLLMHGIEGFRAFHLEDQLPFLSPDGLITPPPTPAQSHVEEEPSERDIDELTGTETETSRDGDKVSQKSKGKKKKRAEFKIDNKMDTPRDHSQSKEVTGVLDIELVKQQEECNRYAGVEKYASRFVDNIIGQSVEKVADYTMFGKIYPEEEEISMSSQQTFGEMFGTYRKWPRIREFCKETGEIVIDEFVQTWEYEEDWMYCIDFLLEQSDECSEYYLYEVKWSIPSKPYPIPQATASVYFTIEVSRVKPNFCPVEVTYLFEGSRMIHIPGKIPFQEHWLFSIIDAKLEMYKRIKF